jgi:hypothetical protein
MSARLPRDAFAPEPLRALLVLNVAGLAALAVGLNLLHDTTLGFSWPDAIAGIGSQIGRTLPAAVLSILVTGLNLLAGAVVMRVALGSPFQSLTTALLGGLAGAILVDTALLMLLGGLGLFIWPVIALCLGAVLLVGLRYRPLVVLTRRPALDPPLLTWSLIAAVWAAPLLLQLGSPVVPFMDVLPNHVAPVEHLRTYGRFDVLSTMPSPIYGPSRIFLGYVALLATIATLANLPAALAVASFAFPLTVLTAVGVYHLTSVLFGRTAGYWMMFTFPLTFVFMRVPDARATALAVPLVAFALALPYSTDPSNPRAFHIGLASGLGAALLVHPLMGSMALLTVLLLTLLPPHQLAPGIFTGAAGAAAIATPQALTMLGVPLPPWVGLFAFPLAIGSAWLVSRLRPPMPLIARSIVATVFVIALLFSREVVSDSAGAVADLVSRFPLLTLGLVLGAFVGWRERNWSLIVAGLAAWILATLSLRLVPPETVLGQSVRFEIPKTFGYWTPFLFALAGAVGLRELWNRPRPDGILRLLVAAALVAFLVLPSEAGHERTDEIVEYRMAESLSIALHHAQDGYWKGYPDARTLIDRDQQEIIGILREEQRQGRLRSGTQVLHFAESFQQWVATPLGVFAGVLETTVSKDPERSMQTVGGRLHGLDEARQLLRGDYPYVVVEGTQLPPEVRSEVVAAGYRPIFANPRGEIFFRESRAGSP